MTSVNFVQEYCFYHVTTEVTTASRLLLLRLNKTREEHSEHPVKHMPLRHMSLGKGVYAVPIGITASGVAHTVDGGEESTCHSCCCGSLLSHQRMMCNCIIAGHAWTVLYRNPTGSQHSFVEYYESGNKFYTPKRSTATRLEQYVPLNLPCAATVVHFHF